MNKFVGLVTVLLLLTACDSVKDSLGMSHYQADEFNLHQNLPLSLPPNYKLMPPRTKNKDGKSVPLGASAEKAQKVVGGGEVVSEISKESAADLQEKAGTADNSIRDTLDKEAAEGESDGKLAKWKKEFVKNAKSINQESKSVSERDKKPISEHEKAQKTVAGNAN